MSKGIGMTTLVIAEHDGGSIKATTLDTVAAAQKIGADVHLLVAGSDVHPPTSSFATSSSG